MDITMNKTQFEVIKLLFIILILKSSFADNIDVFLGTIFALIVIDVYEFILNKMHKKK
jgi:hypothetical protein